LSKPIIIDCDPGIDDAFLLAMAVASNDLEILGVTTSYGNVGIQHTTTNALRVLDWLGVAIPVYAGVDRALLGPKVDAAEYHGATGLEAPEIGSPRRAPEGKNGVAFLIDAILASKQKVTLVASAPLTNIAMALRLCPAIAGNIEQIAFMGGSTDYGNDSPAAEFNMLCDPHAAQIVLDADIPAVMFGLNVTHQIIATPEEVGLMRRLGNDSGRVFADMAVFFEKVYKSRYGFAGSALHDPCILAWLLDPGIFTMRAMRVDVETNNGLSFGRTVHDIWGLSGKPANARVALQANAPRFFDLLRDLLRTLR
jgi:purine nucleosidase